LLDISDATNGLITKSNEYTLTVSGVPTPELAVNAPGSFVLAIGLQASGSTGFSSA